VWDEDQEKQVLPYLDAHEQVQVSFIAYFDEQLNDSGSRERTFEAEHQG
jgi:hypothetical protein